MIFCRVSIISLIQYVLVRNVPIEQVSDPGSDEYHRDYHFHAKISIEIHGDTGKVLISQFILVSPEKMEKMRV